MRGRVAVPWVVLLLLSSLRVDGQCTQTLAYSGQFRATYLDLAIDGDDLWVATSYGVQLFNRSTDPPALVSSLPVPGTTRNVLVSAGVVYAGSGTKIFALRKSSGSISIAGSVDTGGTVNDVVVAGNFLYAATAAGLKQYDLLNPNVPKATSATFSTSGANVTSLAIVGSLLYAADSDSSVEVFSISLPSLPQRAGTIDSLARSTSIKAVPGRIYVSDGMMTDAFVVTGSVVTRVWTGTYGSSSLSVLAGDVLFAAGADRRIRAIDWTTAGTPVEIFAADALATGGSVNRITAAEVAGSRLYVTAGDAGLMTWDVSRFLSPYPVRNYALPKSGSTVPEGVTSTVWVDGKLYAGRTSGGITELTRSSSGSLTQARQWDSRLNTVHDGANGFLLSSAGSSILYWTLVSTTPSLVSSGPLSAVVVSAVLVGSRAYVVLGDKTVWSVDLAQDPARATQIAGASATAIARSANGIVTANVRDDGSSTTLSWYSGGDLSATPLTTTIAGASTSGVVLAERTAAVFTFNGVVLHDFASGTTRVLPDSNDEIVVKLGFTGTRILGLSDAALLEWDRQSGALIRRTPLPVEGSSLSFDTIVASGTSAGVMTIAIDATSQLPTQLSARNGNSYYRKVAAVGDRLYLFESGRLDAFATTFGSAPRFVTSIRAPGAIDFAVTPSRIFTMTSAGLVAAWSPAGALLAQRQIDEGPAVQPLAIAAAGDAVWVSIARSCTTSGCEKKTLVFDAASLVRTATLDGGAQDVAVADGKAWGVFDLPSEVRVYGISNPANPSFIASVAAGGSRAPASIATSSGNAYVLGDRLYTYAGETLAGRSDDLAAYPPEPPTGLSYADQRIRIEGGCSVIVGRTFGPLLQTPGSWATPSTPDSPSLARGVAMVNGRIYILTDHSLEVWSATAAAPAPRRRGAR